MSQLVQRAGRGPGVIRQRLAHCCRSRSSIAYHPSVAIVRFLSSSNITSSANASSSASSSFQLPDPTWPLQDLGLSKHHPPISETELKKLAKRALLDLHPFDDTDNNTTGTTREQLRQDLGNMMHMIEQVQSFEFNTKDARFLEDQADIYDKPRGVVAAPLRRDIDDGVDGSRKEEEEIQAKEVFESFLQPQTTKVGAHNYFSIETKQEEKKD